MTFSETFLVFLVILVVFFGVKFGFRKSCLCKRNDKYKVCANVTPIDPVGLDFCLIHKIHSETVVRHKMQWVVVFFYYSAEVSVLKKLIPTEYPCCFSGNVSFTLEERGARADPLDANANVQPELKNV